MANYFKDFLLNLFFVFLPLILYPYILKADQYKYWNRVVTSLIFCTALILTMSFPVVINNSTVDFRAVPLAIGSLYGGSVVSIFLYVSLITYRYMLESPNQAVYMVSLFPTCIVTFLFIKKFPAFSLFQKIISSVMVYFFIRTFTLVTYQSFTQNLNALFQNNFPLTIKTMIFQCLISGIYVYVLEFFRNNSRLREEIIKSEKIKIVSDIAASVAHEIRNPLTSVRGFIQLMGKDKISNENRRYYQEVCLDELDRAQQIISDYLTLAKPDPEKIEPIPIKGEIDYVSNVLISYANFQNVQIITETVEENLSVIGDRYKFRQALINIGKNGIEAMPGGGILQFVTKKINNRVVLCIIDSGIGMTAEQISRLGTPYYSTKDKGTGLGTMVSFNIIRKMNGKIDIKSNEGKGTTYTISLELMDES